MPSSNYMLRNRLIVPVVIVRDQWHIKRVCANAVCIRGAQNASSTPVPSILNITLRYYNAVFAFVPLKFASLYVQFDFPED